MQLNQGDSKAGITINSEKPLGESNKYCIVLYNKRAGLLAIKLDQTNKQTINLPFSSNSALQSVFFYVIM